MSVEFEESAFSEFEIPLAAAPVAHATDEVKEAESIAVAPPARPAAWSSAASSSCVSGATGVGHGSRSLGPLVEYPSRRHLLGHRGDPGIGVICWGVWSTHTVGATGNAAAAANHHKTAPAPPARSRP